jgi:hypothetical protein
MPTNLKLNMVKKDEKPLQAGEDRVSGPNNCQQRELGDLQNHHQFSSLNVTQKLAFG